MPIKPKPMKFTCPACGWSKVVSPSSDALMLGFDYFEQCPECGKDNLEITPISELEVVYEKIIKKSIKGLLNV